MSHFQLLSSAVPTLVRPGLILLSILAASIGTVEESKANVGYEAQLTPLVEGQPASENATFSGGFPRPPGDRTHTPSCSHEPMEFQLNAPNLEGEMTAIVFRMGTPQGETIFRVPAGQNNLAFDAKDCELMETWTGAEPELLTPFYIVIETTMYPDGALGGPLLVILTQPTLEQTWGQIKGVFAEIP